MKLPESLPKVPARPDAATHYGVQELYLFPRLTRAIFRATYGEPAPQYNPSRRIKRWFDTSPHIMAAKEDDMVSYHYFDAEKGIITKMTLTAGEARTPNLPGTYEWPKYVVAPTPAMIRNALTGAEVALTPQILTQRANAETLAAELSHSYSAPVAISEQELGGPWHFVWHGETRRVFNLLTPKGAFQAALLLAQKYRSGIGAPGRWDVSGAEPVWIPEQTDVGEYDPRPEIPIPVRDLLPGEVIEQGFGGVWHIRFLHLAQTLEERLEQLKMLLLAVLRRLE